MTKNFEGRKLIVIGGSSGIGRETAAEVVARGGSAVIVGRDGMRVAKTITELGAPKRAWGITADLGDRDQVASVQKRLADDHDDATLLVNAEHDIRINTVAPAVGHPALRKVHRTRADRGDAAGVRGLPSDRPSRHRTRYRRDHHIPTVLRHELGDRRNLERRRRRDGRA
jgi:NAD(P)-dependent dehydrogenase (short-subunit alcohol dehydrogenase family)